MKIRQSTVFAVVVFGALAGCSAVAEDPAAIEPAYDEASPYMARVRELVGAIKDDEGLAATLTLIDRLSESPNEDLMQEAQAQAPVCSPDQSPESRVECWRHYALKLRELVFEKMERAFVSMVPTYRNHFLIDLETASHRAFLPLLHHVASFQEDRYYTRTLALKVISRTPHRTVIADLKPYLFDRELSRTAWDQLRNHVRGHAVPFTPDDPQAMVDSLEEWLDRNDGEFRYDYDRWRHATREYQ